MLHRHVGHRVAEEHLEFLSVLMLGPRELGLPVGEGDMRAGPGQRDGGFERRVAAPHDESLLPREIVGVVEPVVDIVSILAGNPEHSEVSALSDRDEDPPRPERLAPRDMHFDFPADPLEALSAAWDGEDSRCLRLAAKLIQERFLDVGRDLKVASRRHRLGVGVDRLRLGEIDDREERLGRLEDREGEILFLRLDCRGHSGDTGADDDEVMEAGTGWSGAERRVAGDPLDDLGAGVEREFEERNAGEVARDVDARHARAPAFADLRERLHGARGPPRVKPARVSGDQAGHGSPMIHASIRTCGVGSGRVFVPPNDLPEGIGGRRRFRR